MEGRIKGNLKDLCEVCGKHRNQFTSAKSFWDHKCIKNRVKCAECSKEFADKVTLKVHMQSIHLNITQNCSICHKSFKSKQNLYQHMKTHNDDKPFKCNNCNKEFRQKEELKKHVYSCKKVVYSATLLSTVVLLESASRMKMAIGLKVKPKLYKHVKFKITVPYVQLDFVAFMINSTPLF